MSGVTCPEVMWTRTTAPTIEPFTTDEAKQQIRSVQTQEDALVHGYIKAARQAAEDHLGRGLLTQTWTLALSHLVTVIPLPMAAPLASVTSVKYYDTNDAQQTLASSVYTVDTTSRPGRLALTSGQTWPAVSSLRRVNRIEITYVVGYTAAALIPANILQGMRMYIGLMDTNRDGLDPNTDSALKTIKAAFWTDRVFYTPPQFDYYPAYTIPTPYGY